MRGGGEGIQRDSGRDRKETNLGGDRPGGDPGRQYLREGPWGANLPLDPPQIHCHIGFSSRRYPRSGTLGAYLPTSPFAQTQIPLRPCKTVPFPDQSPIPRSPVLPLRPFPIDSDPPQTLSHPRVIIESGMSSVCSVSVGPLLTYLITSPEPLPNQK